ncbi:MAG: hypothetical protein ACKO90_10260, partial [Microcystis panniformis]
LGSKHGKTPKGSSFSLPYWLKVSNKVRFPRSLVFSQFIPSRSVAAYQEQQSKIFAEETAQEKCNCP